MEIEPQYGYQVGHYHHPYRRYAKVGWELIKSGKRSYDQYKKTQTFKAAEAMDGGGLGSGGHLRYKRKTWGRKKKKTLAKAWKVLDQSIVRFTMRWQSLSGTSFTSGLGTMKLSQASYNAGGALAMPMYAFNLSWLGKLYTQDNLENLVDYYACPMYRLQKSPIDNVNNSQSWKWYPYDGINNDADGVAATTVKRTGWQMEENNGTAGFIEKYIHNWSDIKLLLYGAKSRQMTIHTDIVQFEMDGLGPVRCVHDGGTIYPQDSDPALAVEYSAIDQFWESWWADKVGNPIRTSKKMVDQRDTIKWVKRQRTLINATETTDSNANPLQVVIKNFLREDKQYSLQANQAVEKYTADVVTVAPNALFNDANPVISAGLITPREQDKWLLIWAPVYDQITSVTDNVLSPSFDINIRSKWTVQ